MQIKFKKLSPKAQLPVQATDGSACFDIHTTCATAVTVSQECPLSFDTGLAFQIPIGFAMLVFSRSGHGFKNDVRLSNAVGVLDSDFRGELKVKLASDGAPYTVSPGERIAQVMVLPIPAIYFRECDSLETTSRGVGGFGSSGK